jgi:hypothetical protein
MLEVLIFFFAVWLLSVLALWRDYRKARRSRNLEPALIRTLQPYYGRNVDAVEQKLGPPSEIVPGNGGRKLYIWNGAQGDPLPRMEGVLIVSIEVSGQGTVEQMYWRMRGAG